MSDPWTELEAELRGLQPRRPSPGLEARLERALTAEGPAGRRSRVWFPRAPWLRWAAGFAVACGAGAALWLAFPAGRPAARRAPAAPPTARTIASTASRSATPFQPVGATTYSYASYNDGLTRLEDGWPARRVYERSVDVYTWWNPKTDASVQWTVPCEAVQLVPLDAY